MAYKQWNSPPPLAIDAERTYAARIETEKGIIRLELFARHAPRTVNNFIFLAREGFYDGVTFHRVIPGFVIQGGDPTGSGRGGPGYAFADETKGNPLKHETGSLSMANAGPDTNGSQFFITHAPQPHLDGRHTVFGRVVAGQDVVEAIRSGDTMLRVVIEE
jgi:peptidyl-prolyl cis-trans isomerase B (cyclophilin B)